MLSAAKYTVSSHLFYDEAEGGQWSRPPAFPSAAGGLVSTIDDYLAFGQMMLSQGKYKDSRILSRLSIETMTTDQLTPGQKAVSGLIPGYFDSHDWGFGLSVVTRRNDVAAVPGRYGWDGGMGTSWYSDPREDMITILMTQRAWTSPQPTSHLPRFLDFGLSGNRRLRRCGQASQHCTPRSHSLR